MITKVRLENGWISKQMISAGEAAILLETTRRAFLNQEKSKISYSFLTMIASVANFLKIHANNISYQIVCIGWVNEI